MVNPPSRLVVALKGVAVDQTCLQVYINPTAALPAKPILPVFYIHHLLAEAALNIIEIEGV